MRLKAAWLFWWLGSIATALGQVQQVKPQVLTKADIEGRVTAVEVAAHFVTAIRMPEAVNSVVVGDPELFQVEHSDREAQLVFVKVLTTKPAVSNLLVSTTHGQEVSLLLISRGAQGAEESVDFLLKYKAAGHFLIEPDYPTSLVAQTLTLVPANTSNTMLASGPGTSRGSTESIAPLLTAQVDSPAAESADVPGAVRRGGL